MATANAPIAANRTTSDPMPIIAAGPKRPTIASTASNSSMAAIIIVNERTFSEASSMPFICFTTWIKAHIGIAIAVSDIIPLTIPDERYLPISDTAASSPVVTDIKSVNAKTFVIADDGSILLSMAITPVNITRRPTIAMRGAILTVLIPFIARIISAKEVITAVIAPAAERRLFVSMNDSATIDAAITPIEIAIIIIDALTFCAPFRALIMTAIMALSKPTAIMPLAKPPKSIKLSNAATPASIAIERDMARIVPATLAIFCSLLTLRIDIIVLTKTTKPATNAVPLIISLTVNFPTSLQTPTISMREIDILKISPLSFAICCFFPILVTETRAFTKSTKAAEKAAPLNISSAESILTSLQTPTKSAIAIASLTAIPPTLLTLLPALFATFVIEITKIVKPVTKATP